MKLALVVGPTAPPVHGFSAITDEMRQVLGRSWSVRSCVTSGSITGSIFRSIWAALYVLVRRPGLVYIAFSAGGRQVTNLVVVAAARLARRPVVFHHHSFAYLDRRSLISALCFRTGKKDLHIVLCQCMEGRLRKRYDLTGQNVRFRVLSNIAFVAPAKVSRSSVNAESIRRIGFLSNITREKGIFEFFSVLRFLADRGESVRGVIAGPVAPIVEREFREELARTPNVEYVGAVYGHRKAEFFESLDVFVFPTLYKNEAEPVTIWEALSYGVPTVAYSRGCISDMLRNAGNQSLAIDGSAPDRIQLAAKGVLRVLRVTSEQNQSPATCASYDSWRQEGVDSLQLLCVELDAL